MKKLIETEHISFSYEEETGLPLVLEDVSISIGQGEFVAVLGHNGSGKSTFAKHCNAVLLPRTGHRYGGRHGYERRGQAV